MITIQYYIANRTGMVLRSFETFAGATVYHLKYYIGYSPLKLAVFLDVGQGQAPLGHATPLVDGETYYVLQQGVEYQISA
jgi:hypothetical protein